MILIAGTCDLQPTYRRRITASPWGRLHEGVKSALRPTEGWPHDKTKCEIDGYAWLFIHGNLHLCLEFIYHPTHALLDNLKPEAFNEGGE
jgi:hypothetical protein